MTNKIRYVFFKIINIPRWYINGLIQKIQVNSVKPKHILVLIMLPGYNLPGGGILSLLSLFKESKRCLDNELYNVVLCNINGTGNVIKQSWFKNDFFIFNENALKNNIKKSERIIVHLPEHYTIKFIENHKFLLKFKDKIVLNIYNQNSLLMPDKTLIKSLKSIFYKIVITVNFSVDVNNSIVEEIGIPLHWIPSWFVNSKYNVINYNKKSETIIISPDSHPNKIHVLNLIKENYPEINIIEIKKMDFFNFLKLQQKSKWALTFGEGYDGYFVGSFLFGGICFSVKNSDFFPKNLQDNSNDYIYESYSELQNNLIRDINFLKNNPEIYDKYSAKIRKEIHNEFSHEIHVEGIKKFYKKDYTIKPNFYEL
jgi:hypothetical protein